MSMKNSEKGTHLTDRKELGKLFFVQPIPLLHQMIAEDRHVRLRSTKGNQTEWPKGAKDCTQIIIQAA